MRKFPELFQRLMTADWEREYSISTLFGPGDMGFSAIERVRLWLAQLDTAGRPMVPVTTSAMPQAATKAVERAAEARKLQLAKMPASAKLVDGIMLEHVFRRDSVTATEVFWESSNNPPQLGDRVRNLCADTVPFGLQGTVISTHGDSNCVEVVFDEEFLGGTTLGGVCSSRRGKLIPWGKVLQISGAPPPQQRTHRQRTLGEMGLPNLALAGSKAPKKKKKKAAAADGSGVAPASEKKKKKASKKKAAATAMAAAPTMPAAPTGAAAGANIMAMLGVGSAGGTAPPAPALNAGANIMAMIGVGGAGADETKAAESSDDEDVLSDYWAMLQATAKAKRGGSGAAAPAPAPVPTTATEAAAPPAKTKTAAAPPPPAATSATTVPAAKASKKKKKEKKEKAPAPKAKEAAAAQPPMPPPPPSATMLAGMTAGPPPPPPASLLMPTNLAAAAAAAAPPQQAPPAKPFVPPAAEALSLEQPQEAAPTPGSFEWESLFPKEIMQVRSFCLHLHCCCHCCHHCHHCCCCCRVVAAAASLHLARGRGARARAASNV